MNVDMIEDIVEDIEAEYNVKVDIAYDFMPADSGSVLDSIDFALDPELGSWIATGEVFVLHSKVAEDDHISVLLLKRGVELNFIIPHSCKESAKDDG